MFFWYCHSCWQTEVPLIIFPVGPIPPDAYKSILYLRLQWSESCLPSLEASGGQNWVWTTFASPIALLVFLKVSGRHSRRGSTWQPGQVPVSWSLLSKLQLWKFSSFPTVNRDLPHFLQDSIWKPPSQWLSSSQISTPPPELILPLPFYLSVLDTYHCLKYT